MHIAMEQTSVLYCQRQKLVCKIVYSPSTSETTRSKSNVFWSSYIRRWLNSPVSPRSRLAFFLQDKDRERKSISRRAKWHSLDFEYAKYRLLDRKQLILNLTTICKNTYRISSQVSKLLSRITNSCKAWFTKPYIAAISWEIRRASATSQAVKRPVLTDNN